MALLRTEVADKRKWNLDSFFKSEQEFEDMVAEIKGLLPALKEFENKITIDNAWQCLEIQSKIGRRLEKVYIYANLKKDEDTAKTKYQALSERMSMLAVEMSTESAFVVPQISKLSIDELNSALTRPEYTSYTTIIDSIIREKQHILSDKEERILSEVSGFAQDFKTVFGMFDNADIKFDNILDTDGKEIALSHGMYAMLLQHPDQEIRKRAFETYYKPYINMANTIAANYSGNVKKNCTTARIRNYKNALHRALYADSISDEVYNNLIDAVKEATPTMHEYVALRKKALNLDELHMYDMYVPITNEGKLELDYDDAYQLMMDALHPLGERYINMLKMAYNDGWIDVEETKNKRSGAYSWGCYDSKPVVLLNYQKTTHDVFTIAHEMGHALHTYLSNQNQCYEKAEYVIFVAEIASTVNEVLLLKHLLKTAKGDMKKFLLSYYLDMFRTTLFRQTMFAEFEKYAHEEVEAHSPLTAQGMSEKYLELNKEYYGSAVIHDKEIANEWSRIPHFYNAFYVYKYATGLTSAINIVNKILTEDDYVDKYFKFLSAGGSDLPLEILKIAEIDLSKKAPFEFAMNEFKDTLKELEKLI